MKLQQNVGMSDEGVLLDELEKLGKNTYMRKSECGDSWFVSVVWTVRNKSCFGFYPLMILKDVYV